MPKRVGLSALAGAVTIFVLASVLYGVVFEEFFRTSVPAEFAGVSQEVPNFGLIFLADLLYAAMLAFVFAELAGVATFYRGAVSGMIIGFLIILHFDLIFAATTHLTTPASVALDVAISTFMSALGGGVVGAVLGRVKP